MENKTIYIDIKFSTMVVLMIKFWFAMIATIIIFYFFIIILSVAFPPLGEFFNALWMLALLG